MKMLRALSLALILSVPGFMNAGDVPSTPTTDASANTTTPSAKSWSDTFTGLLDKVTRPVDWAADAGDWVEGKAKGAAGFVEDTLKYPYRNYKLTTKTAIAAAALAVAAVVAKKVVDCNRDARFECEDCDN